MDSVCDSNENMPFNKGQTVRSKEENEEIFRDAGLMIMQCSEITELNKEYYPVAMWSLY